MNKELYSNNNQLNTLSTCNSLEREFTPEDIIKRKHYLPYDDWPIQQFMINIDNSKLIIPSNNPNSNAIEPIDQTSTYDKRSPKTDGTALERMFEIETLFYEDNIGSDLRDDFHDLYLYCLKMQHYYYLSKPKALLKSINHNNNLMYAFYLNKIEALKLYEHFDILAKDDPSVEENGKIAHFKYLFGAKHRNKFFKQKHPKIKKNKIYLAALFATFFDLKDKAILDNFIESNVFKNSLFLNNNYNLGLNTDQLQIFFQKILTTTFHTWTDKTFLLNFDKFQKNLDFSTEKYTAAAGNKNFVASNINFKIGELIYKIPVFLNNEGFKQFTFSTNPNDYSEEQLKIIKDIQNIFRDNLEIQFKNITVNVTNQENTKKPKISETEQLYYKLINKSDKELEIPEKMLFSHSEINFIYNLLQEDSIKTIFSVLKTEIKEDTNNFDDNAIINEMEVLLYSTRIPCPSCNFALSFINQNLIESVKKYLQTDNFYTISFNTIQIKTAYTITDGRRNKEKKTYYKDIKSSLYGSISLHFESTLEYVLKNILNNNRKTIFLNTKYSDSINDDEVIHDVVKLNSACNFFNVKENLTTELVDEESINDDDEQSVEVDSESDSEQSNHENIIENENIGDILNDINMENTNTESFLQQFNIELYLDQLNSERILADPNLHQLNPEPILAGVNIDPNLQQLNQEPILEENNIDPNLEPILVDSSEENDYGEEGSFDKAIFIEKEIHLISFLNQR